MSPTDRRFRPIRDLEPLELVPLIGPGASLEQLRRAARSLADGYALECLVDDRWNAVGYAGTQERAHEWVELGGEPDCAPDL